MSHLLTNATNERSSMIQNLQNEINKIPNYLTKRNEPFKEMMSKVLSTIGMVTTNNHRKELRKMIMLIYKIMVTQNYHLLWSTYLKSGMGQLITPSEKSFNYSVVLPIWPKETKLLLQKSIHFNQTNENEMHMTFVNNLINELNDQLKQYETDLNERKNRFSHYTFTIQEIIDKYLEQNLSGLRREIEHQVKLIYYDYHIEALKRAYEQHNPNQYQVC